MIMIIAIIISIVIANIIIPYYHHHCFLYSRKRTIFNNSLYLARISSRRPLDQDLINNISSLNLSTTDLGKVSQHEPFLQIP